MIGAFEGKPYVRKPVSVRTRVGAGFGIVGVALITAVLVAGIVVPTIGAVGVGFFRSVVAVWNSIPEQAPADIPLPQHSTLLDVNGVPYATFYGENRIPVSSEDIPPNVKNAFIALEDKRFSTHSGWDPKGTLRALLYTLTGRSVQGGSSITQQYVKNLLVFNAATPQEASSATAQTPSRKVKELKSALALEKVKTKDEIVTGYLNTVYFGDRTYGIGAASRHYFGVTPDQLTAAQAATLAGIVTNANLYNPVTNPDGAVKRRDLTLLRMEEQGYLTPEEYTLSVQAPLSLNVTTMESGCAVSAYPFYCAWVRNILETSPMLGDTEQDRAALLYRGGLTIRTALDPAIQNDAQNAVEAALSPEVPETAMIAVVQPGTGNVPAIAQTKLWGEGEGRTQIVLPASTTFQQGSTFKPLTAAAAIEHGFSPTTRFTVGSSYTPQNRNAPEGGFRNNEDGPGGDYDIATALRRSSNTWFVALEDKVGVTAVAEVAKKMGITSLPTEGERAITEKDASLTLGTYDTSPIQVANSFATLAAHGVRCNPTAILSITTADTTNIPPPPPNCQQVIRPTTADTITVMLQGVIDDTTDPGRTGTRASLGRPAAGKTGTSDSFSSVWFAGYTTQYAAAVAVSDPRGGFQHPIREMYAYDTYWNPNYGGGAPALMWKSFMTAALDTLPATPPPATGGEAYIGVPYAIPNVVGLPYDTAAAILTEAGYTPTQATDIPTKVEHLPAGIVTRTDPPPGHRPTVSPQGTPITLWINP